jgi:RNA-directed DNA polymerase
MSLVDQISISLQLPPRTIAGIARKASYSYKQYHIPKRSGGNREIFHPAKPLKALQRWLLQNLIVRWRVHDAAFAYRKGYNIANHAACHASSNYLLRLDLVGFFPSITADDVTKYIDKRPIGTEDWGTSDLDLFISLVCRNKRLSIGAPTSPALSNALCYDLDMKLAQLADRSEVTYTRYADDLFFSSHKPNVLGLFPDLVTEVLANIEFPSKLRLNEDKTRHSSRKSRRQVTGIVLTSDKRASLGRARKRFIRHQIHRFDALTSDERENLKGLIAFAMCIEPDLIDHLILKYGRDRVIAAWKGS